MHMSESKSGLPERPSEALRRHRHRLLTELHRRSVGQCREAAAGSSAAAPHAQQRPARDMTGAGRCSPIRQPVSRETPQLFKMRLIGTNLKCCEQMKSEATASGFTEPHADPVKST